MIRLFTPAESISFKVQIFKVNKKNSLWAYKKTQNALWDVKERKSFVFACIPNVYS